MEDERTTSTKRKKFFKFSLLKTFNLAREDLDRPVSKCDQILSTP